MRINFRQGLIRYQTDTAGTPTFLQRVGNYVNLTVSPDPTIVTFADGTENYTHEERVSVNQAWGPFSSGTDYWLYIDIDPRTAVRTFGHTTLEPAVGIQPPSPMEGQVWFDRETNTQKVFSKNRFVRVLRVFVAKLSGGTVLEPENLGSQVGLWGPTTTGFILFDENDRPVLRQGSGSQRRFLTTASELASQFTGSANFAFEGLVHVGTATQSIPAWSAISLTGPAKLGLASYLNPDQPAIGVVNEDVVPGEVVRIIYSGVYTSSQLDFSNVPVGTPLYVDNSGQLTPTPPQQFSIQQVATVIDHNTIWVDIKQIIRFSAEVDNPVPLVYGKNNAELYATGNIEVGSGTGGSGTTAAKGHLHIQNVPLALWDIQHNAGTELALVQVYTASGELIIPDDVTIVDVNTVEILFATPIAGRAHIIFFEQL